MKKRRIEWLDMAKGLGILLVMIGHFGIQSYIPKEKSFQVWLYSFHIPLFFFLSGYLFSVGSNLKEFVIKKLHTIVVPYFALGSVILLYNIYAAVRYNRYSVEWLKDVLRRFVVQDRFWTIWFLACVLVLNILMYVMVRLLKKTWVIALAAVILAVAGHLYYHFGGDKLPWDVDVAFCAMPFFGGGFLIRRQSAFFAKMLRGRWRPFLSFCVCLVSNIYFCWLNFHIVHKTTDMFSMQYGIVPLMYLSAFSGIAATALLSRWLILSPICYIGENSLVFFALHQEIAMPIAKNLLANVHFTISKTDPGR